jgi:hypothetical protein
VEACSRKLAFITVHDLQLVLQTHECFANALTWLTALISDNGNQKTLRKYSNLQTRYEKSGPCHKNT